MKISDYISIFNKMAARSDIQKAVLEGRFAVMMIDVQNKDHQDEEFPEHKNVFDNTFKGAGDLVELARAHNIPVIWVASLTRVAAEEKLENTVTYIDDFNETISEEKDPETVEKNTFGKHDSRLTPLEDEPIFIKRVNNGFTNPELKKYLHENGLDTFATGGTITDQCISTTITSGLIEDKNFKFLLAKEASDFLHGKQEVIRLITDNAEKHMPGEKVRSINAFNSRFKIISLKTYENALDIS